MAGLSKSFLCQLFIVREYAGPFEKSDRLSAYAARAGNSLSNCKSSKSLCEAMSVYLHNSTSQYALPRHVMRLGIRNEREIGYGGLAASKPLLLG